MKTSRRDFIKTTLCATCGALVLGWHDGWAEEGFSPADSHVKEAYSIPRWPMERFSAGPVLTNV